MIFFWGLILAVLGFFMRIIELAVETFNIIKMRRGSK